MHNSRPCRFEAIQLCTKASQLLRSSTMAINSARSEGVAAVVIISSHDKLCTKVIWSDLYLHWTFIIQNRMNKDEIYKNLQACVLLQNINMMMKNVYSKAISTKLMETRPDHCKEKNALLFTMHRNWDDNIASDIAIVKKNFDRKIQLWTILNDWCRFAKTLFDLVVQTWRCTKSFHMVRRVFPLGR